jgi:transposase
VMGTPSARTLVDMASGVFQELEEVPMTIVGGFDVHRKQITFDYVDNDGLVRSGQIRPATRTTLRHWLSDHGLGPDAEFALEGCTGWRYVVDELTAAGVVAHVGDPAEIATLRGPKMRAKTDRADARLLRTLLLEGRFPESWIPPGHVTEMRTLGRLYCTLMDERPGLAAAHPRPAVSPGLPTGQGAVDGGGSRGARAGRAVSGGTAIRRYGASSYRRADRRNRSGTKAVGRFRAAPAGVPGAAGRPVRCGLVMRGDHVSRDR